ncbi:ABC transporter permease [Lachnospira eligens]|uniref:FtsX-like permease family protein n=1 Tax=Lachnospira eligens TaxID=39485 RepID=A0A7C9H8M2_9FIRM|nr:ABC transporter permease [Lachnospira eligens]MSC57242.1 FtsX-like permease family protein [Lachnospira eligens]
MLFKISLKNIRKSLKDYTVYFFTLILGVAIFYVFNAIDSQSVMLDVRENMMDIIKLMNDMLSGVSVFVSCILGFLIIYASRFLIKRRNKEFGIYLTLGMSKRKISAILFFETLLIGIVSLVAGLVIGTILSQFMSVIVANMFDADMTKFKFIFSMKACVKTLIYFAIMYVLVMIFNTFSISRCKLIDLLNAGKKTEKVTMKNPVVCTIVFVIGVGILSYAYWMVTRGVRTLNTFDKIGIPIALGCVATFLIFWSVSGFMIRIFTSIKSVYYKGVNSFVLRQFCSKINTTVFSTTVICIMLFITISVLSAALSMKDSLSKDLDSMCPVDVQLAKYSYDAMSEAYATSQDMNEKDREMLEDSKLSIIETLNNSGFDAQKYFKDVAEYNVYNTGLTVKDTLGDINTDDYQFIADTIMPVMTIGDYNSVARLYGNSTYELNDDEYIIVADYKNMVMIRNQALKKGITLSVNGKEYKPRYNECKDGFVHIGVQNMNDGILVVPDNAVKPQQVRNMGLSADYRADTKEERYFIETQLDNLMKNISFKKSFISWNSRIDLAESSVGLGALVTFIALYLGIIFLISSAAILALRELSDSADNKERYGMLRKLGVDERMIDMALFKQIGIFFAFPLILALIHSVFGIKFINIILATMGMSSMAASIGLTLAFVAVIYGGYFLITYLCSRSIIRPVR